MKKQILIIAIAAIFVLSIACNVLSYFAGDVDELDVPDYDSISGETGDDDDGKDDGQSDDTTGDSNEGPVDWYKPQVPFSELYDTPKLGSADWMINKLYPNITNDDFLQGQWVIDPNTGQLIYSIEGTAPGLYLPQVDQVGWGNFMLQFDQSWSGPPPDVVFPCDQDINTLPPGQDWFTLCPPDAHVNGVSSWHVVYSVFDAPIPWGDPDHSYTYAAVFDGDGIPDNNFQWNAPYDWDYWQGTDQWYIVDWMNYNQEWNLYLMGPNGEPFDSNARVVIYDDAVFWIIPSDEFAVPQPGARVSSFASTGGWDPENVGGDVNGNDPTEPLTPLTIQVIPVNDPPYTEASIVLDDDYEICGPGLCKYNEKTVEQQKTEVWCTDAGCSNAGGECSLFSRARDDSPQEPDSWTYVAGSNTKMQKDWTLVYHCYCVK